MWLMVLITSVVSFANVVSSLSTFQGMSVVHNALGIILKPKSVSTLYNKQQQVFMLGMHSLEKEWILRLRGSGYALLFQLAQVVFITAMINHSYLSPQIWSFIYSFTFFTFCGYITNSQCDQLPDGLIAQSVEHCTGIAEVMGSNRAQAWIPFRP